MRLLLIFLCLVVSFGHTETSANDRTIHREKSLYRNILVKESDTRRCLVFAVKRGDRNQTCTDLRNPDHVVFPYVRMTFAGLLLKPEPRSVLIVGLGGGTIPVILNEMYPAARIEIVEIDPAVVRVAEEFFGFTENAQMKVHVRDARVHFKRALLQKESFDLVILDAFTGDYIPEHLMTREFLEETASLLTPTGVVVANTFATSKLYDHESETYRAVFGDFYNLKIPRASGNRVIVASNQPLVSKSDLRDRANRLSSQLYRYRVDIDDFPGYMSTEVDWDEDARVLTDQFAPANLLQGEKY